MLNKISRLNNSFMQEKSIIKQKILLYLDFKGISPYKFYKDTDTTRGILTQNNGITEENLLKFIAYAQDISLDWLLTGEGAMLKGEREPQPVSEPPSEEPEVVEVLRQQLAEKDRQIAEKDRQLAERDKQTGILLRMLSAQKTPEKSPIGGG